MGKLQMTILAFIAISCCIHIRRQLKDRDYIKHLFLGNDSGKSRILYLDYVRLIAALFVILVHCLDFSTAGLTSRDRKMGGGAVPFFHSSGLQHAVYHEQRRFDLKGTKRQSGCFLL
ncbi:MAG: hypothetical protein LBQ71_16925 [Hungatella sp.]|jgi:hypothetical protein|nr:hypothetical protein [Hungatella sp.]